MSGAQSRTLGDISAAPLVSTHHLTVAACVLQVATTVSHGRQPESPVARRVHARGKEVSFAPMRIPVLSLGATIAGALLCAPGCSDAGLYAVGAAGPGGPDRVELKGQACVPLAAGDAFPVKVLFALQGGAGMDANIVGELVSGLNSVFTQFSTPYISFAITAHHSIATGLQGSFVRDSRLATATARYAAYAETGPMSHRAALRLANSLISGDMQTSCRGQVARTRYLIVLVMATADESCANPVFNANIALECERMARAGDVVGCTACELTRTTDELRAVGQRYNAGEVTVQPIYVRSTPDDLTRYQAEIIARSGGTTRIETTLGSIENTLTSLNYASLQRGLTLKRLIAMNRNARSRAGAVLVDSDGDGVPDEQEQSIGTNPTKMDSDDDGLGDGVELKMGLPPQCDPPAGTSSCNPLNVNVITACNPSADTDGDRLNDCEERVLGTDGCIADTDGDGVSDLVELLEDTNPLIPEDLRDDDRDGLPNVGEVETHSDSTSADIEFQQERGYGYAVKEADPTPDGRSCYDLSIYNISLVPTLARPSPDGTGIIIPRGTNDIYVYFQVGRENDPRGTGIGSVFVPQVRLTCNEVDGSICRGPSKRPRGTITFNNDDFVPGF